MHYDQYSSVIQADANSQRTPNFVVANISGERPGRNSSLQVGPKSATGKVIRRIRPPSPSADVVPELFTLEQTLDREVEELRVLTEKLERRVASVASIEHQRAHLLQVVKRQQKLFAASHSRLCSAADPPAKDTALACFTTPSEASHPIALQCDSVTPRVQRQTSTVQPSVDASIVLAYSPGLSILQPAQPSLSPRGVARAVDVAVTPTMSESREIAAEENDFSTPLIVDLTPTRPRGCLPPAASSAAPSISSMTTQPSSSQCAAVASTEILGGKSAAVILSSQVHQCLGAVMTLEEDLLHLQDELIRQHRTITAAGDDSATMEEALLMQLRLVVRDELSKCKKRESVLQATEDDLTVLAARGGR